MDMPEGVLYCAACDRPFKPMSRDADLNRAFALAFKRAHLSGVAVQTAGEFAKMMREMYDEATTWRRM